MTRAEQEGPMDSPRTEAEARLRDHMQRLRPRGTDGSIGQRLINDFVAAIEREARSFSMPLTGGAEQEGPMESAAGEPTLSFGEIRAAIGEWWNDYARDDHAVGISLADPHYRRDAFDELARLIHSKVEAAESRPSVTERPDEPLRAFTTWIRDADPTTTTWNRAKQWAAGALAASPNVKQGDSADDVPAGPELIDNQHPLIKGIADLPRHADEPGEDYIKRGGALQVALDYLRASPAGASLSDLSLSPDASGAPKESRTTFEIGDRR